MCPSVNSTNLRLIVTSKFVEIIALTIHFRKLPANVRDTTLHNIICIKANTENKTHVWNRRNMENPLKIHTGPGFVSYRILQLLSVYVINFVHLI